MQLKLRAGVLIGSRWKLIMKIVDEWWIIDTYWFKLAGSVMNSRVRLPIDRPSKITFFFWVLGKGYRQNITRRQKIKRDENFCSFPLTFSRLMKLRKNLDQYRRVSIILFYPEKIFNTDLLGSPKITFIVFFKFLSKNWEIFRLGSVPSIKDWGAILFHFSTSRSWIWIT